MKTHHLPSLSHNVAELNTIIQNFKNQSPEQLEFFSELLGLDLGFWDFWTIGEVSEDDLESAILLAQLIKEAQVEAQTEAKSVDSADNIVKTLKEICESESTGASLTQNIYVELARLTAEYSSHHNTKTVYCSKKGKMTIKPEDAFEDGSKDTFEDNGEVALNYYKLVQAILKHARTETHHPDNFQALAKLYCFLTTLSSDACNQQNAIEFAEVLQNFAPIVIQPLQNHTTTLEANILQPLGEIVALFAELPNHPINECI